MKLEDLKKEQSSIDRSLQDDIERGKPELGYMIATFRTIKLLVQVLATKNN